MGIELIAAISGTAIAIQETRKLIDKLIEYRLTLRSLQKYEESDVVRDILTDSNIEIEDNKESSSWKFKD